MSHRPHSHILMVGGGPMDFFGSEISAYLRGFFSVVKKHRFFGNCIFFQLKSTITKTQFTACVGFFLEKLKMEGCFWVDKF